ncbi:MAG: TM2 domain-containing protein [Gemmatimonadaceae bacterium]
MPAHLPTRPASYCQACGAAIGADAAACTQCGTLRSTALMMPESEKRIVPALVLCCLLGVFGAHRFYAGRIGTGLLQLFTLGGLGIWVLVDMVLLVTGAFHDGEGDRMTEWV